MGEMNPYQPPASRADTTAAAGAGDFNAEGRAVDAGRGWEWIASGFALFKKQPGTWILILIVLVVCSVLLSLVPLVGGLANMLLLQVFMGGVMLGCRALESDEGLEVGHLFAGFKQNTSDLVVLGVLALVAWVIIAIPAVLIMGGGSFMAMMHGNVGGLIALGLTFVLAMLVVFALSIPLYMALWFAPSLIVFHNLKPVDAMKASFFACLKNLVPFLVYGVILLALSLVAAIPFGLGFLVLVPVIAASVYTAYRDIFFAA
jgi:hypothetical protein